MCNFTYTLHLKSLHLVLSSVSSGNKYLLFGVISQSTCLYVVLTRYRGFVVTHTYVATKPLVQLLFQTWYKTVWIKLSSFRLWKMHFFPQMWFLRTAVLLWSVCLSHRMVLPFSSHILDFLPFLHIHGVIRNDCPCFNNLSYTIHYR